MIGQVREDGEGGEVGEDEGEVGEGEEVVQGSLIRKLCSKKSITSHKEIS